MKKLFILIAAITLISALILGGCSQTNTSVTAPAPAPTTTAASPAAKTTAPTSALVATTAVPPAAQTTTSAPTAASTLTPKYGGTFRTADNIVPSRSIGWFADGTTFIHGIETPLIIETLLKGDVNGVIGPNLATAYEVDKDLKTITLTLRQGVKFHDGSDFNAAVVKWNLDQFINAKLGDIKGLNSVDVIDNYTVRLNTAQVTNLLITALANAHMVSEDAYNKNGGDKGGKEYLRWHPVGTGPFKFVSYETGVRLKAAKFDNYWQKGKPYLDAVEVNYIADPMTRSSAFEAGELDACTADASKVDYDLQQKGYNVTKSAVGFVCLTGDSKNTGSPFSNVKVRQAVDYAIDKEAIVKSLGYGFYSAADQFANPGTSAYIKDLQSRKYDPAIAKQTLTAAGYASGFSCKLYGGTTTTKEVVTAI